MATNIKITALSDITSANMTYNDLVAVVDMNGTPETKKANVQIVGNLILSGAGGSYFAKAAQATNAETVSNAAQPNITSTGTLTAVTVTGNVAAGNVSGTAGVFTYVSGDGANLTNLPSGSNSAAIANGTSNVNIPALNGNINTSVAGNANILIVTGTGANVTGTFNATGNAVVGNISATNLGNVSAVNLDGNVLNILHGDGSWSADATSYGNSNVVTLMGAFGSNTITTTGVITGDGSGLSAIAGANVTGSVPLATLAGTANAVAGANVSGAVALATSATSANAVAYANVSGTPTLGNISTINIDGNVSNVLRGDGTFAADADTAYGDSNVVTLLNAFGSNTVVTTGNISAGNLISGGEANIFSLYVDTGGANIQSNVIIGGDISNVNYINASGNINANNFIALDTVYALNANVSGQFFGDGGGISNIAVANVTGLGNIASINLDGNVSNVLRGDGSFAADANSAYGDSNVVTLLGSFGSNTLVTTGNISAGNVNSNVNGFSIGYLEIPQVSLTADDTIALEDSGKHFYSNTAGNITLTIPTNATVAFPIGTAISIVEEAAGNILVNATAGVNLYLAGNATAANRVLGTYGMATLMKVSTDTWFMNGAGVS